MAKKKKRADGRLVSTFRFDGKRHYVYGSTAAELSEKEHALRMKLEAERKSREAGIENYENPTLDSYYETFTTDRRGEIKESTIRCQYYQFRNCADTLLEDTGVKLGEKRIRDITPKDIKTVRRALSSTGRTTETVNNCMAHLSHVFYAAVQDETITRNPCKGIKPLKRTEKPARETIHRALSKEETAAFMKAAKDSPYYNAFCLMLQTGMRIGEVAALGPLDIESKNGMLHVNKTVTRNEIGGYEIGSTPKTDSGNRVIPMTAQAAAAIQRQRMYNRAVFGDKVEKTIFRSPEGALMREYPINREINRICKRTGVEKFTCHALRATFATRFIEQRPQDYKILSEILGHKDISITLNLYTHAMKENKITAMQSLNIAM